MRQILPLELAGLDKLDFDLFNEKGEVIYNKNEPLTPNFIMMLNYMKVYKTEDIKVEEIENLKFENLQFEEDPSPAEMTVKSAISGKASDELLNTSKGIIQSIIEGKTLNVESCQNAADVLLSEVSNKIEKVDCISELRVYDKYTFSHAVNVSSMSSALGIMLKLDERQLKDLAMGTLLHDIGKMMVPREILMKPGKLEPEEFEIMKSHTVQGYNYIRKNTDIDDIVARIALDHQEKYSGIGYPNKLAGRNINFYAQITSILDVYDALISKRVYKPGLSSAEALKIMLGDGSKSFNPFMLYKFIYLANYRQQANIVEPS